LLSIVLPLVVRFWSRRQRSCLIIDIDCTVKRPNLQVMFWEKKREKTYIVVGLCAFVRRDAFCGS